MKLEKLSIKTFKKNALTFDSLKSILGGNTATAEGGGPATLSDARDFQTHDVLSGDGNQTWYPSHDPVSGTSHNGDAYNDGCA